MVLLGATNFRDREERHETLKIDERIRHPDYLLPSKYNDIALLKLERSVAFSPSIRPACLADEFRPFSERTIATGWGRTESQMNSDVLLKVVLDWISHAECNTSFRRYVSRKLANGIQEATQICAGSKEKRSDTCQGDSGGPLQIYHRSIECMYSIVGVTSFGIGCGLDNQPGVYTRVFSFIDWIEGIVWPQ